MGSPEPIRVKGVPCCNTKCPHYRQSGFPQYDPSYCDITNTFPVDICRPQLDADYAVFKNLSYSTRVRDTIELLRELIDSVQEGENGTARENL